MYSINMSEFRKKKEVKKPAFTFPKITPVIGAAIAAPMVLLVAFVFYFDYAAVSAADAKIEKMVAHEQVHAKKHRDEMRELAGKDPVSDVQGRVLTETYTFDRTLPLLSPRTVTVVYGGARGVSVMANASLSEVYAAKN